MTRVLPNSSFSAATRFVRLLALAVPAALATAAAGCTGTAAPTGQVAQAGGGGGADLISEEAIRAHVRFLSDDLLEGRAPGSRGGELAAAYVRSQFEAYGLEPVEGSHFQPVPIIGSTPDPASASLRFSAAGGAVEPSYPDGFVIWTGNGEAPRAAVEGELVFVGYAIDAPEAGWSDFEEMDVRGKVLLVLVNDPPPTADEPDRFDGEAMTYYGRWTYKFEEAARRGAAGALVIHTTEEAGYPWSVVRSSWTGEQFSLPADPAEPQPVPVEGWVTHEVAGRALALAGLDLAELVERAGRRDFAPVSTGIEVSAAVTAEVRSLETANVVALLRGSERPEEVVTITSHYDHLGIGDPVDGDSIYNGAYDNASGVAVLLEVARVFASAPAPPARSILFIGAAAEEAGLLGSSWYVQSPLFPLEQTVATINIDGANLWGEADDYVAMGEDRNELGRYVRARAEEMGITLVPDPEPEKGYFFRSDHFPFARAGVPALYIEHGREFRGQPEGWGDRMMEEYVATRYHQPGDVFSEDFVYDGAVQHGTLLYLTALDIAMDSGFPNWFEDSEFRAARDRTRPDGR